MSTAASLDPASIDELIGRGYGVDSIIADLLMIKPKPRSVTDII